MEVGVGLGVGLKVEVGVGVGVTELVGEADGLDELDAFPGRLKSSA
nr:hypothetical protein [Acidothermus cellulolyticus]